MHRKYLILLVSAAFVALLWANSNTTSLIPLVGNSIPNTVTVGGLPGAIMPNAKFIGVAGAGHVASGDVDLYTVPANRIALIVGANAFNDSGSPVTIHWEVKIGATYYQITANQSVTGSSMSGTVVDIDIILTAGEKFSVNVGTASVINPSAQIWECDATANISSSIVTSFVNGENTIYTVPAGKSATLLPAFVDVGAVNLYYFNATGMTVSTTWHLVPNGGSVGPTNLLVKANPINTGMIGNIQSDISMNAGDFVSLNVNNTGQQIAWVNLLTY